GTGDVLFLNRDFLYHYQVYFPVSDEVLFRIELNPASNNETYIIQIINETISAGRSCFAFKYLAPSRYYGIYDFGNTLDVILSLVDGHFNYSLSLVMLPQPIFLLEIN
ncbi:MAG: hypothetical protein ACXQS8_09505, partial [Candidatus Helarchaeales archaeon]